MLRIHPLLCINSSKVYCKFLNILFQSFSILVLIVAKCIVNTNSNGVLNVLNAVLIVAKCIVNLVSNHFLSLQDYVLIVAKCIVNYLDKSTSS